MNRWRHSRNSRSYPKFAISAAAGPKRNSAFPVESKNSVPSTNISSFCGDKQTASGQLMGRTNTHLCLCHLLISVGEQTHLDVLQSQQLEEMAHFLLSLRLIILDSSEVLDPTCSSGPSISINLTSSLTCVDHESLLHESNPVDGFERLHPIEVRLPVDEYRGANQRLRNEKPHSAV